MIEYCQRKNKKTMVSVSSMLFVAFAKISDGIIEIVSWITSFITDDCEEMQDISVEMISAN